MKSNAFLLFVLFTSTVKVNSSSYSSQLDYVNNVLWPMLRNNVSESGNWACGSCVNPWSVCPCCDGQGKVRCFNASVFFINWFTYELPGTMPSSIADGLPDLGHLDWINCGIRGTLPSEIGRLTNLRQLWLSNNQLSGSIPLELANISKLRALSLNRNQLSGDLLIPSSLSSLLSCELFPTDQVKETEANCFNCPPQALASICTEHSDPCNELLHAQACANLYNYTLAPTVSPTMATIPTETTTTTTTATTTTTMQPSFPFSSLSSSESNNSTITTIIFLSIGAVCFLCLSLLVIGFIFSLLRGTGWKKKQQTAVASSENGTSIVRRSSASASTVRLSRRSASSKRASHRQSESALYVQISNVRNKNAPYQDKIVYGYGLPPAGDNEYDLMSASNVSDVKDYQIMPTMGDE